MHLIADAADIEDHVVLAITVDQALELADHAGVLEETSARCSRYTPPLDPSPQGGGEQEDNA